jgi:hypothetical protein
MLVTFVALAIGGVVGAVAGFLVAVFLMNVAIDAGRQAIKDRKR